MFYDKGGMTAENKDPELRSFGKQFTNLLQDYYPERLFKFYVLNPNLIFKIAYALMKPFLAKKTKEKVITIHLM